MISALITWWHNRKTLGSKNQTQEMLAFLPAAMELQESPPNPLARWLAYSIFSLFMLFVTWAIFGSLNIVATADGKVIPSSRVKVIQPINVASIKEILVKEGDFVTRGQELIKLDSTQIQTEFHNLEKRLNESLLKRAIEKTLLAVMTAPKSQQETLNPLNISQQSTTELLLRENPSHNQLLWQKWLQYWSSINQLHQALESNLLEQISHQTIISKLEQTLPLVEKRRDIAKTLTDENYFSEMEYLTLQQRFIEQSQDLQTQNRQLEKLKSVYKEATQQAESFKAESIARHQSAYHESHLEVEALTQELNRLSNELAKQTLKSPVDGHVQQLQATTIGGVVTAAQQLMLIVPQQSQLEVEVMLENKDIGYVEEGMQAEIKVHTFPFTKYGVLTGTVIKVSNDAIVDERKGLVYSMLISIDNNLNSENSLTFSVIPGMEVTAEIKTGTRRIIEFFLQPLLQHGKESLRER